MINPESYNNITAPSAVITDNEIGSLGHVYVVGTPANGRLEGQWSGLRISTVEALPIDGLSSIDDGCKEPLSYGDRVA